MADTTSLAFPNMFNASRNRVDVLEDTTSVVNRTRLLMLTEPTELYNNPTFGVGLKKYLWQYNTSNTEARIQDNIKAQLDLWEPCVDSSSSYFASGQLNKKDPLAPLLAVDQNELKMTVGLATSFGDTIEFTLNPFDTGLKDS